MSIIIAAYCHRAGGFGWCSEAAGLNQWCYICEGIPPFRIVNGWSPERLDQFKTPSCCQKSASCLHPCSISPRPGQATGIPRAMMLAPRSLIPISEVIMAAIAVAWIALLICERSRDTAYPTVPTRAVVGLIASPGSLFMPIGFAG